MKYLINMMYDGSELNGYATQPNKNTVQDEIERILSKMLNCDIKTFGASRTDARVHALNQYATFELEKELDCQGIMRGLNAQIKPAIKIKSIKQVDQSFNPRYDVVDKVYEYHVMTEYNPFKRRYAFHQKKKIDIKQMEEACQYIVGTHDFTSFCNTNTEVIDKVRTVKDLKIEQSSDGFKIVVKGNGFLYNMVRIIAGTLISVGEGRIKADAITGILEAKDRTVAPKTMPPEGLFLVEINY